MACFFASASMCVRENGLPISSSGIIMTVTGSFGRRPVAWRWASAENVIELPPFMS